MKRVISFLIVLTVLLSALLPATVSAASDPANGTGTLDSIVLPGTQTAPVGNNFHRSGLRAATGAELGFKAGATSFVKDGKILGTHPETDVAAFLATLADAAGVTISDASGKAKTKGKIATGDKVSYGGASYIIVIDGDVTADGKLDAFDFQMLKAHVLGNYTIPENQLLAADTTGDKLIDAFDFQMLKAHVLGTFDMFEKYKPIDDPTPGHKHDYKAVVTAPTCTEKGYTTYTCSCGDSYKDNYMDSLGHNWTAATCTAPKTCSRCHTTEGEPTPHSYVLEIVQDEALKAEATCSGAAVYYKSCVCGKISTNDEDVFTYGEHLDHLFALEIVRDEALKSKATCEDAAVYYKSCTCGEISNDASDTFTSGTATGHSYKETSSTDATCTEAATVTYSCECCKAFYTETVGDPLEHDIAGVTAVEKPVKNCEYVLTYVCKREGCGAEVEGEHVFHHDYTASITKEPTCKDDGEKTLTCTCGDVKTETLPKDASAHQWVKGEPDPAGVRTDECSCCKETKTVTVFTGTVTDEIATDALKDSEIEVGGIGLSFDAGAADALGDDPVTLGAETLDDGEKESLGLSEEQLKQIGDNPIYNLTVTGEAGNISRFGEGNYVTVTIPYEPADGEDVDSIAIWYIDDKGEPEAIKAVCRGGFVTFATNHFSCYTVTRLTNEERCALYGHSYEITHIPGNCTANSYDLYVCVRCHETHTENVVAAPGHDYAEETHPATCTEDGYILYSCKNCPRTYRTKLPATGHEWSVVKTVDATCTAPGSVTYGCAHCTETYSVATAMLPHVFGESVVTKQPTCEEPGESVAKCATCDETIVTPIPATGHEWNILKTTDATCSKPGSVTYKCGTCGKEKTTEIPATGKHIYENGKCKYCGKAETECDHTKLHTVTIDLDEYGCCEGYVTYETCDCGEYIVTGEGHYNCEFEILENENGYDENNLPYLIAHQKCKVCGLEVFLHSSLLPTEEPCVYINQADYSFTRNGEVIWETTLNVNYLQHDEVRTDVDATEFGICGGTLDCYRCTVCGEITYIRDVDLTCPVDFNHYDEETFEDENGNLHTVRKVVCPDCGFTIYVEVWTEEESSCVEYECHVQRIFCGDNVLYEHEIFGRMDHHIYETTYELLGESCADGVKVTLHCTVCGETDTYTEYYHETNSRYTDLSEYGLCGGTFEEHYCEVCGKVFGTYVYNERCQWEYQGENEDGYNVYVCVQCGAVKYTRYTEGKKDEYCLCADVYETIYFVDGEEVLRYERYEDYYDHDMKYSYNFLGETCEDGVEVTEYCPDCGHTYTYTSYGHEYDYRYIDLADFGLCGGEIEEEYCIRCGTVLNSRVTSEDCAFEYVDTLEDGTEIYECSVCGARNTWHEEIGEKDENCEYTTTTTNCYFVNGEEVYHSVNRRNYVNHAYEYTYVLLGETCYDGVEVTEYCPDCGYEDFYTVYGHETVFERIDAEELGLCGGYFEEWTCRFCGELTESYLFNCPCYFDYIGFDDEGREVFVCSECGTQMRVFTESVKDEHCVLHVTETEEFVVNGKVVYTTSVTYNYYDEHDYEFTYELQGETCEDGVIQSACCKDCGYTIKRYDVYDYHKTIPTEQIDLSQFGCVCGGYATLRSCVCGQETSLDLMSNARCDFDWKFCDNWIEGVLKGSRVTENGEFWFDAVAHLYTCAVTSPACGFAIRYENYWLPSEDQPCRAEEYQTWQFGYDRETGTCAYELTFKTGDNQAFHNYKETSKETDYNHTYELICENCGSSYTYTTAYNEDGRRIKEEEIFANTLDNGDNKLSQTTKEYDYDDNGEQCLYRYYRKIVYADGTEYWYEEITETTDYDVPFGDYGKREKYTYNDSDGSYYSTDRAYARFNSIYKQYPLFECQTDDDHWARYDYTYSFENGCMRTVTYANSDGTMNQYEEDYCYFVTDQYLRNTTCTQDGLVARECVVCGKAELSHTINPYGHTWVRKPDGTYFCSNCGMENANGADGSIIMEDLTNAHGNGEYYVVGYYLRNDSIDFTKYVTLLLPDGSEIIVNGIEFTTLDDLRCVAFKKADVEAFAEENGYTDYLVRFTFVPYDDDFDLDYSVIFYDIQPLTLITGTVEFMDSVGGGQTKTYLITPTEDSFWAITSYSELDPYAKLYDAEGNELAYDDDGGETGYNFFLTYELKAGETYTLVIDWYGDPYGYFDLVFTCEP